MIVGASSLLERPPSSLRLQNRTKSGSCDGVVMAPRTAPPAGTEWQARTVILVRVAAGAPFLLLLVSIEASQQFLV